MSTIVLAISDEHEGGLKLIVVIRRSERPLQGALHRHRLPCRGRPFALGQRLQRRDHRPGGDRPAALVAVRRHTHQRGGTASPGGHQRDPSTDQRGDLGPRP